MKNLRPGTGPTRSRRLNEFLGLATLAAGLLLLLALATYTPTDPSLNTAGSYALAGAKVPRDSTIAAKLRKAGAVILGKANLSQWANFRSSNSTNGWSAYGGQVSGAYYPLVREHTISIE